MDKIPAFLDHPFNLGYDVSLKPACDLPDHMQPSTPATHQKNPASHDLLNKLADTKMFAEELETSTPFKELDIR